MGYRPPPLPRQSVLSDDRRLAADLSSDAALEAWATAGTTETLTEWQARVTAKPVLPKNVEFR